MASLDQMEGDAIELAAVALLVLIVVAIALAYLGNKALLNWLLGLLSRVENWLKNLLSGGGGKLNPSGTGSGASSDLQVQDPNTLYQIPDATAYNGGLLPLLWYDAAGNGNDTVDSGSGVGVSINGGPTYFSPSGGS